MLTMLGSMLGSKSSSSSSSPSSPGSGGSESFELIRCLLVVVLLPTTWEDSCVNFSRLLVLWDSVCQVTRGHPGRSSESETPTNVISVLDIDMMGEVNFLAGLSSRVI